MDAPIRSEIETNPDIDQEPVGRWPPWRKIGHKT